MFEELPERYRLEFEREWEKQKAKTRKVMVAEYRRKNNAIKKAATPSYSNWETTVPSCSNSEIKAQVCSIKKTTAPSYSNSEIETQICSNLETTASSCSNSEITVPSCSNSEIDEHMTIMLAGFNFMLNCVIKRAPAPSCSKSEITTPSSFNSETEAQSYSNSETTTPSSSNSKTAENRVTPSRKQECVELLLTQKETHQHSGNSCIPYGDNHDEFSELENQENEVLESYPVEE